MNFVHIATNNVSLELRLTYVVCGECKTHLNDVYFSYNTILLLILWCQKRVHFKCQRRENCKHAEMKDLQPFIRYTLWLHNYTTQKMFLLLVFIQTFVVTILRFFQHCIPIYFILYFASVSRFSSSFYIVERIVYFLYFWNIFFCKHYFLCCWKPSKTSWKPTVIRIYVYKSYDYVIAFVVAKHKN